MNDKFRLSICSGKYEYEYDAGKQTVWRNGELWWEMNAALLGNKFVYSLAVELDEANKRLAAMRDILIRAEEAIEAQDGTSRLNEKLVDDYRDLMRDIA